MDKPRVIIFGASNGGERFLRRCGHQYQPIAFCDNDRAKVGTRLSDLDVVGPDDLAHVAFDRIVIASMYGDQIRDQLIRACGIAPEQIDLAPLSALTAHKSYRPFEDPATRDFALGMLEWIHARFNEAGIPFLLDHGTLLGFYRDGGIIPWDDDLDLSVEEHDAARITELITAQRETLPLANTLAWSAKSARESETGRLLGIVLGFAEDNPMALKPFGTAFWCLFRENGQVRQCINQAPARFFEGNAWLVHGGHRYRIPADTDAYLAHHYGAWRTPVKDLRHEDINNYHPPPPMRWDLLFGSPAIL